MEEFIGFVKTMAEVTETEEAFLPSSSTSDFLRRDETERFSNIAAVMKNMPLEEASYLRVPRVGEEE